MLNNGGMHRHAGVCVCACCWGRRWEDRNPPSIVPFCLSATDQYRGCWLEGKVLVCKSVCVHKPPQAMCFTCAPFRGRTGEQFYSTSIDWGSVNREREAGLYPMAVNCVCLRADMLQDKHSVRLWLKGQHSQHSQLQAAGLCMSTATSVTNNILYGYYIKNKKTLKNKDSCKMATLTNHVLLNLRQWTAAWVH